MKYFGSNSMFVVFAVRTSRCLFVSSNTLAQRYVLAWLAVGLQMAMGYINATRVRVQIGTPSSPHSQGMIPNALTGAYLAPSQRFMAASGLLKSEIGFLHSPCTRVRGTVCMVLNNVKNTYNYVLLLNLHMLTRLRVDFLTSFQPMAGSIALKASIISH
jgi:hypothetical protein